MKEKTSQRLTKAMLIEKLREIAGQLENDTLRVGERTIILPESLVLTLEWKEKINQRKLEIEIEW